MQIALLHISSKGEDSVTLACMQLLVKMCKDDVFRIVHAVSRIRPEDEQVIKSSSLVIIAGSVHQYMMSAAGLEILEQLKGCMSVYKPVTLFSTSDYAGDMLFHQYVSNWAKTNNYDFIDGLSLCSSDALQEKYREELYCWFMSVRARVEYSASNVFVMGQTKAAVSLIDTEPEYDEQVEKAISDYKRDYERYGCAVKIVKLRDYGIQACTGCQACRTNRMCGLQDDFNAAVDNIYTNADIIIPVGKLKYGFYSPLFKAFIDRHAQFGRCPSVAGNEQIFLFVYLRSLQYRANDENLLEQWQDMYCAVNSCVNIGIAHGYSQSKAIDTLIAAKFKRMPQRGFYWVGGNKQLAEAARVSQKAVPLDYAWYKEHGWYDTASVDASAKPIGTIEDAKASNHARAEVYNNIGIAGAPEVHERRTNKDISPIESKLSQKPVSEVTKDKAAASASNIASGLLGIFKKKG